MELCNLLCFNLCDSDLVNLETIMCLFLSLLLLAIIRPDFVIDSFPALGHDQLPGEGGPLLLLRTLQLRWLELS